VSRYELWTEFINEHKSETVAEIGVFRGEFAEKVLSECTTISTYYMVDPWRHLDAWNKPANHSDDKFELHLAQVLERTAPWASARKVLRGRTLDVIEEIPSESLDFAYIDGDHTLRGITIDLGLVWPRIKPGGFVGGDDFKPSVWQHGEKFEPTFVFPYAVYFAESVGAPITALPHGQFLIEKVGGFSFTDTTGRYGDTSVGTAVARKGRRRVFGLERPRFAQIRGR
jgi:hypothetical protein